MGFGGGNDGDACAGENVANNVSEKSDGDGGDDDEDAGDEGAHDSSAAAVELLETTLYDWH